MTRGQVSHDSQYWMRNLQTDGERLMKKHATSRPDYLWPEIWKDMSDAAQRKEERKWAIEKPKLDSARRLRGIYFIDASSNALQDQVEKVQENL